ncbi:MAG: hypothetical protein WCP92_03270 [bacterium]
MTVSCTISPLTAWINTLGPEPYGALSNAGFVRLFAIISSVTFAIPCTVPVTVELLFPVAESKLVVVIFAVFTKVVHDKENAFIVHVSIIVHPLPAGSVPRVNVFTGSVIPVGTRSVITTLSAALPQLFP